MKRLASELAFNEHALSDARREALQGARELQAAKAQAEAQAASAAAAQRQLSEVRASSIRRFGGLLSLLQVAITGATTIFLPGSLSGIHPCDHAITSDHLHMADCADSSDQHMLH